MTTTQITVRGRASTTRPPDRGTVHARVHTEGPDSTVAYDVVAAAAAAVRASLEPLLDAEHGPVRSAHVEDVQLGAGRRWEHDGREGPVVHHAQAVVRVEFDDAVRLGRWLSDVATVEGFAVDGVSWTLLPEHRARLVRALRAEAVRDARAAAEDYAAAAGLGSPRFVAIADAGMLGSGEPAPDWSHERGPFVAMSASGGGMAGPHLELAPRDVEVTLQVDARLTTGTEEQRSTDA